MSELHEIRGLEIFAAGTWNGDSYSNADLDAMVQAFHEVGFQPALKVGHSNGVGERAWGFVTKLWRSGSKLLADIADIPAELFRTIKERGYDRVSSEIAWEMERNGRKFPRVLTAVALLGSETPAVDLIPIRAAQLLGQNVAVRSYSMKFNHSEGPADWRDAERQLDDLAKELALDFDYEYPEALSRVMADPRNRDIVAAYMSKRHAADAAPRPYSVRRSADASAKLHDRVVARMKAAPTLSYKQACESVINDPNNRELREQWAQP